MSIAIVNDVYKCKKRFELFDPINHFMALILTQLMGGNQRNGPLKFPSNEETFIPSFT